MDVHEYIYQTGECLTYDIDAGLTVRYEFNHVEDLLANSSGRVPKTKTIHYLFNEFAYGASLFVTGKKDELILMAEIIPYVGPSKTNPQRSRRRLASSPC